VKLFRPLLGGALLGALIAAMAPIFGIEPFGAGPATTHHASRPAAPSANPRTGVSHPRAAPAPTAAHPPPPVNNPAYAAAAQQAIRAAVPNAQVGVEVFDRQSGVVLTNVNDTHQFPTMSVVKVLIALDVLDRNGWALPSQATQEQLTRMISYSDDGIANDLWGAYGGPDIVTQMSDVIGLHATTPPSSDPGEWGDTLTSPSDLVTLYRYITEKLPAADRNLLINAMYNAPQTAADDTDQYFGIPDGLPRSTWAIKQGWGTSGTRSVVNTTGLVGADNRYVVVVLTSSTDGTESALRSAITTGTGKLAKLVS
jgi:beta-lactamase class A